MTMENFDDVIFDEDEFLDNDQEPQNVVDNQDDVPDNQNNNQADDLTNEVLRLRGISDPEKIKFEDESGAVIERSWSSLSREEQLNILLEHESNDLDDDEIDLLNKIRNSGMSVNDYLTSLQPEIQQPEPSYKIDQLSDEDVYALDLLEKIGSENITDEELEQAINSAKQNETLFKKTVEGLRKEYIRLQQDEEAQQANEVAAQQEAAYQQFATSINNEIRGLNSFAGQDLELSADDAEELASFMLELDENGISAFGKALQDPALFTKAAFWLLNENQIIEELNKQMQNNYKKGYEAAKADLQKPKVVFNAKPQPEKQHDEFVDDDEW